MRLGADGDGEVGDGFAGDEREAPGGADGAALDLIAKAALHNGDLPGARVDEHPTRRPGVVVGACAAKGVRALGVEPDEVVFDEVADRARGLRHHAGGLVDPPLQPAGDVIGDGEADIHATLLSGRGDSA